MTPSRPALRARSALLVLAMGLVGCASVAPTDGHLLLRAKGVPSGVTARFSVTGHGVARNDIGVGTSLSLPQGTYRVDASTVHDDGLSYLPVTSGVGSATVSTRVRVKAARTVRWTQEFVLKAAKAPPPGPVLAGWRQLNPADPFPITDALDQLACASATFCMAIGGPRDGDLYQSVWSGSAWSAVVDTGLAGTEVNSLSCPTSRFCLMGTGSSQFSMPTFIDVWNGGSWTSKSPLSGAVYYIATCASADFCMIIAQEQAGHAAAAAVSKGSGGWQRITAPSSSSAWQLDDVSCPATTFCVVAFATANGARPSELTGLVELWQGGVWRPQDALKTDADWVGCSSTGYCLLFGDQPSAAQPAGQPNDVYANWNGSEWTQVVASPNADPSNYLFLGGDATPACAGADACYETGSLGSSATASAATELLGWNGSDWTAVAKVDQGGSAGLVACAPLGYCLETGSGGTYADS